MPSHFSLDRSPCRPADGQPHTVRHPPPPTRSGCPPSPQHRDPHQPVAALADQPPQARCLRRPARAPSAASNRRRCRRPRRPPARPTVQTLAAFSSSSARAMLTTVAIRACASAPADALPTTPSSAAAWRVWRMTPVDARRVARPQDRADVVRILDAVEHDDQRRRRRRRPRPDRRPRSRAASSTSATTPWCTPPRAARSSACAIHALDRHPLRAGQREDLVHALVAARARRAAAARVSRAALRGPG